MLKLTVNGKYHFDIDRKADDLLINSNPIHADIKKLDEQRWHIINNFQSYNVEVIAFSSSEKTAEIKINNHLYRIAAKDQFDLLLDKLGLSSLTSVKISDIKAPMPGMVLNVFVNEGMEIKKGDNLFTLE